MILLKFSTKIHENLANSITILNLIFGCISIILSINAQFNWAIACIIIAGIADRYDGKVARKFQIDSELGKQLDSMGDVISFGVAPALCIYLSQFLPINDPIVYLYGLITVFYMVCGAFRLARYNIIGTTDGNFTGVPITACGVLLTFFLIARQFITPFNFAMIMILLGYLMISRIKIKKF